MTKSWVTKVYRFFVLGMAKMRSISTKNRIIYSVFKKPGHGMCFLFFGQCLCGFSATTQNGQLPILDTCGTSHFDKKMPRDGCCNRECDNLCLQKCFTHRSSCIDFYILQIISEIGIISYLLSVYAQFKCINLCMDSKPHE